jgi:hypothetical protein
MNYPIGTEIGVKCPYMKTYKDGNVGLRNDNPENIVTRS